jgi:hypothetical protein
VQHLNQASACIPEPWQSDQLGNGFYSGVDQDPEKLLRFSKLQKKNYQRVPELSCFS